MERMRLLVEFFRVTSVCWAIWLTLSLNTTIVYLALVIYFIYLSISFFSLVILVFSSVPTTLFKLTKLAMLQIGTLKLSGTLPVNFFVSFLFLSFLAVLFVTTLFSLSLSFFKRVKLVFWLSWQSLIIPAMTLFSIHRTHCGVWRHSSIFLSKICHKIQELDIRFRVACRDWRIWKVCKCMVSISMAICLRLFSKLQLFLKFFCFA